MDKEKAKALSKTLACYKELQENNSVNLIEFHTADGNDLGFKSERFAQALPYFHKTLEQTFFRTVKASITAMAGRDSRCIDDRNRASYEMCQMLASMLEDTRLPFI